MGSQCLLNTLGLVLAFLSFLAKQSKGRINSFGVGVHHSNGLQLSAQSHSHEFNGKAMNLGTTAKS